MASQIGAQMYTLREHLKTPADMAKTCRRVKDMGYDAIQLPACGPIEPEELGKILKNEGLTCAATHVSLDMMKEVDKCVAHHQALDCKYTAIGGFFTQDIDKAGWIKFAKEFSDVAKKLQPHGLIVGYHNHSHEFVHYDGSSAMQLLVDNTDKKSVWFEIDTYWVAHGGGDPAAWIDRVAGRIPCVHFKDMVMGADRTHKMTEIGDGNLNWPRIIESCKAAGVEWYLVERDSGELDPFDSLKRSLDNMREMGLQ